MGLGHEETAASAPPLRLVRGQTDGRPIGGSRIQSLGKAAVGSPGQEAGLALGSQPPFRAGSGEKRVALPSCRVQAGAWLSGPGIQSHPVSPIP